VPILQISFPQDYRMFSEYVVPKVIRNRR